MIYAIIALTIIILIFTTLHFYVLFKRPTISFIYKAGQLYLKGNKIMSLQFANTGTQFKFDISGLASNGSIGVIPGVLTATSSNPGVLTLEANPNNPLEFIGTVISNGTSTVTVTESPEGITAAVDITFFDPATAATTLQIAVAPV